MELNYLSIFFILLFAITGLYKVIAKKILVIFDPAEIVFIYMFFLILFILVALLFKPFREKFINMFSKCKKKCNRNTIFIVVLLCLLIIGHKIAIFHLVDSYQVSEIIPVAEVAGIVLIVFIGLFYFKETLTYKTIIGLCNMILGILLIIKPTIDIDTPHVTAEKRSLPANQ